jgi:serine/threonine-protein kinase
MDITGIVAILMVFGLPMYAIKRRYDLKERNLKSKEDPKELEESKKERKLLQERVENLESIVTNVDYELNLRIAKLVTESASRQLPAAEPDGEAIATGRTMTAAAKVDGSMLQQKAAALRAAASPVIEIGSVVGKRYRVVSEIGRGGMGAVYLADDEVLGEEVALKVIASQFASDRGELVDRFRREVSAARKVSHANVIRIHDLGEADGGLLFISMEYFAGRTLAELLEQRGALSERDLQGALGQICDGLEAAHGAGVVHRDLKPQNVLVGDGGMVKLIDFGLAKTEVMASMTATGIMLGTPYYMSPEQVRGKEIDVRSDIYSLGALAFHAATGEPPFPGDNPIAIGFAHCSEPPRSPRELRPKLSESLSEMIVRALEKDPRDRPQTVAEFRSALG